MMLHTKYQGSKITAAKILGMTKLELSEDLTSAFHAVKRPIVH